MSQAESLPPHAPALGRMRKLLGSFHVTGVFWYRLHRWGVSILPDWAVGVFIVLFTTFFFVVLRRIRAAIASNLEAVLGPAGFWQRQARIYRTFWNFAWCLSERYEMLSTERHTGSECIGETYWREERGGLVLTTAHIGHWEVGAMIAPQHGHRSVHVVREEEMDKEAQEYLRQLFDQQGGTSIRFHFARDDPTLGLRMLTALRRGDIVALQADRPRTRGRTVAVELFDRPFEVPAGPIAMARAADAPILPVFVFRLGRRHARVVFRPPIRVARSGSVQTNVEEAARHLAREIEWAIRQAPHQWFCFHPLWSDRPGETSKQANERS